MHLPHVPRRNAALLPAAAAFGLFLLLFGLLHPGELFSGMRTILLHEDVLITDYIQLSGIGPAFVNAGLVTLVTVAIFYLVGETPNGSTVVTISLMAGFSLFGKNILNIWPILFGTAVYASLKREPLSKYVNVAMLGTSLAPMVSFMGCDVHPLVGTLVGVLIGFLIAPVSEYAFRIQNGMNLYSTGFACGLVAMIFVPIFKALAVSDSVYLHDLVGYFTQHRVACTLSQLHCLLQPFMSAPASITLSELQKCVSGGGSSVDLRLP